jgi:hypothetical protein
MKCSYFGSNRSKEKDMAATPAKKAAPKKAAPKKAAPAKAPAQATITLKHIAAELAESLTENTSATMWRDAAA